MSALKGIPAILFVDTLSGILRFLPLTLTVSFVALGIMLNNMPWLIAGFGAIFVWILSVVLQWVAGTRPMELLGSGPTPDLYAQTCSLIPGLPYFRVPSTWFALMGYFMVYILLNASKISNAAAATGLGYTKVNIGGNTATGQGADVMLAGSQVAPAGSIGVSQRKAVGLLSIIAVSILFTIIMIPRFMNQCESIAGILLGLLVGTGLAAAIYNGTNANPSNPLADIHGVMLGLSPGYLRHSPIACLAP